MFHPPWCVSVSHSLVGHVDGELLCDLWASLCHPMPGARIRQGQQRDAQLSPLTSLLAPLVWLFKHHIDVFFFNISCLKLAIIR